ncbi:MAG TPA: hypothetical protein VLA91_09375 [Acidimicrobiia bacterium]|nr:hypothetical protein [Acidimicrobiia bacterium]
MSPVSDAFLLELAGITASLLGFFVVGVFFYVQRGLFPQAAEAAQQYLQAATRSVVILYGMTLSMSLSLVVLNQPWPALLYLGMSMVLLWSVIRTSLAIGRLHRALEIRVMPQIPMWIAAAASLAAPWVLGGTSPSREQLTVAILLLGAFAFASSASLVLSTFDISQLESSAVSALESEALSGRVEETEGVDQWFEEPDESKRMAALKGSPEWDTTSAVMDLSAE